MALYLATDEELRYANELLEAAKHVRLRAYAPYSNYLFGAAIVTQRNKVYAGCNVECADYDGTHAEESAISAMIGAGDLSPSMIMVVGGDASTAKPTWVAPCGKCRQKLWEFVSRAETDLRVLIPDSDGQFQVVLLSELLPMAFGPKNLSAKLSA